MTTRLPIAMGYQEYTGIMLSLLGFIYFVFPELEKPSLVGCLLMVLAGIAWGMYSLIGANSTKPLYDTASNFIRLAPILLPTNHPLNNIVNCTAANNINAPVAVLKVI